MMDQIINWDIDTKKLLLLDLAGFGFLLLFRVVTVIQYVWLSRYRSRIFITTACKDVFCFERLKVDFSISTGTAIISVLLVPAEHQFVSCLLLAALSRSFRKTQHEPAIGLAWSFYFGYLKKVLPKFSTNVNRAIHKDSTLPKLFILVPADCKIYKSVAEVDERITFAENLEPHQENVAGIQERRYIHSSYEVRVENFGTFFAALEYATPLNTLKDMCSSSNADFTESDRDRQALLFYDTIKYIIEYYSEQDDPTIKDTVEFVFLPKNANVVDKIVETLGRLDRS